MVLITLYNSKIFLSLHYFLTPQFQTFTNLLIGICGVSNPAFFEVFEKLCVNIVNIISNNTVLHCHWLWKFVSIRRLLQLRVCIGVSAPPYFKNMTSSFVSSPLNRYFSHVTKSRIFKSLNLRKKADHNFRGTFLKNRFRHLKLYSNPPSWLARSHCHMGTFWKTKDWSSRFWESQPLRFWYVEVHCQRRLKSTKTGISS